MVPKRRNHFAPATKEDIGAVMVEIGKLYFANERWKNELKRHFDVIAENIRHDLMSANRDEIELLKDRTSDHKRRINRLETRVDLA